MRLVRLVGLATAASVALTPAVGAAHAASIQITLASDPSEDRATAVSASGLADSPNSTVNVTVRPTGGAPCPATPDGRAIIDGAHTAASGPYAVGAQYVFPEPREYELCGYLDEPGNGDARTTTVATIRPNIASIAFDLPAGFPSGRPSVISITGATEVPRLVFATITPVGGAGCGDSYALDEGDNDLVANAPVEGTYRVEQVDTLRAGSYLLCAWVQETSGDPSAEASVSTTIAVGAGLGSPLPQGTEAASSRFPAKLQVLRASVRKGTLNALFSITGRATGSITVDYQAAGSFNRYRVDVGPEREGEKQVRLIRPLNARQRKLSTGILNLGYAGNATTQGDMVRLRAANGRSHLKRDRLMFSAGRLDVAGSINRKVSGTVRLRTTYLAADGSLGVWNGRAPVRGGAWSLVDEMPPAAASDPNAYLTIQFTGDKNSAGGPYRGEQDGKSLGNLGLPPFIAP